MARVTLLVERGRASPLIIVSKEMTDPSAFRHQVRWLTRANGHPVARIHRIDNANYRYESRFEGQHTLATLSQDPSRCHEIVRRLWLVVERLHRSGLSHHSVRPEHVIVTGLNPILISPQPLDDGSGARDHDAAFQPAVDVTQFGELLSHLGRLWHHDRLVHPDASTRWIQAGQIIAGSDPAADPGETAPVEPSAVRRQLSRLDLRPVPRRRWRRASLPS